MGERDLTDLAPYRQDPGRNPLQNGIRNDLRKVGTRPIIFEHDWRGMIRIKTCSLEDSLEIGTKLLNVYPIIDNGHEVDALTVYTAQQILPNC